MVFDGVLEEDGEESTALSERGEFPLRCGSLGAIDDFFDLDRGEGVIFGSESVCWRCAKESGVSYLIRGHSWCVAQKFHGSRVMAWDGVWWLSTGGTGWNDICKGGSMVVGMGAQDQFFEQRDDAHCLIPVDSSTAMLGIEGVRRSLRRIYAATRHAITEMRVDDGSVATFSANSVTLFKASMF